MSNMSNGNGHEPWDGEEHAIQTDLDPVLLAQLQMLEGKRVQGLALWQDSIADEEMEEEATEENRVFVDFDLYLEGQNLLEVYAATVYRSVDDEPMVGLPAIANALGQMAEDRAVLSQVTTDDEDGLVLVFTTQDDEILIAPSGWVLGSWDELPEEDAWDE
jgi:hypothetical protein